MKEDEFDKEAWKKELERIFTQNKLDVEIALNRIQELINLIGSFNVIANISYLNIVQAADDYTDYDPNSLPVVAEYVALLCLKQPFSTGNLELSNPMKFHSAIQEIQECGLSIVIKMPFINSFSHNKGDELNLESMEELARNFESEEYFVRNPAFETHHWEILEDLFMHFNDEIKEILGFSVDQAIDLCYNIGHLMMFKSQQGIQDSFNHAEKKYYEFLRYKSNGIKPNDFYSEKMIVELSKLSKKELKDHFNSVAELHATSMLGNFYSFTTKELSQESKIDKNIVQNFLNSLSIGFQEIELDFREPQAIHPLKDKPIIRGEERYIVPAPSLLDWSIDKLLENTLLKATGRLPNRFKSKKHDYLINKTIDSIKEIINDSETYSECEYFFENKNGESDGIILWDDCLFIIEAKGHKITDSAKRGGVSRVERHIDDIFNHAYKQGIRTLKYIDSAETVQFKPKGKKTINIRSSDYPHKFLIINSFAQLGHIAPLIKKSNELKIFDGDHYPYVVSIYDIVVLRDILDFPSLFPYYLQRRSKFFEVKKFRITDEVDILGNFLNYGLYFDHLDPENEADNIVLPQFLEEFNQYYFYLEGLTSKMYKKPSYKLDIKVKNFIQILEKSTIKHKISATLLLLDLSPDTQKEFMRRVEMTKRAVRKDKRLHDFSLGGKREGRRWGITYMTHPNKSELSKNLYTYCQYKAKQQGAEIWIGIGDSGLKRYEISDIITVN